MNMHIPLILWRSPTKNVQHGTCWHVKVMSQMHQLFLKSFIMSRTEPQIPPITPNKLWSVELTKQQMPKSAATTINLAKVNFDSSPLIARETSK